MAWTADSGTTNPGWASSATTAAPGWTGDSSTTTPGWGSSATTYGMSYAADTSRVAGWGQLSAVTEQGDIDFRYQCKVEGALRVSSAMPFNITNSVYSEP